MALSTDEPNTAPTSHVPDAKRLLRVMGAAAVGFVVLYGLLDMVHRRFPYIQPGAVLVTNLKHDITRNGTPFNSGAGLRVMAFGDSRTLSGFIPTQFDSELRGAGVTAVESFNFGLPGDTRFVDDLEAMIARGSGPNLVLLTEPWPAAEEPGPNAFRFLSHDDRLMESLFPFRNMPRDVAVMIVLARGSPAAFRNRYLESEHAIQGVARDRGYHFILEQNREFPGHAVPAALKLPSDTPDSIPNRRIPRGPVYARLLEMLAAHGVTCLFVPTYHRENKYGAPPSMNADAERTLAGVQQIAIVGPDYLRYPNPLFADLKHLNADGAARYTRDISTLVVQWIQQRRAAGRALPGT